MKPTTFRQSVLLIAFAFATLLATTVANAGHVIVHLENGKRIKGNLDAKTDAQCIWVNSSTQGIVLRSNVSWNHVKQVTFGNEQLSGSAFRDLCLKQQVVGSTPAEPPIRLTPRFQRPGFKIPAVQSLQIVAHVGNWDADADVDGIVLHVLPRSARGELIPVNGSIDITLFGQKFERVPGASPEVTLERWSRQTKFQEFHPEQGAVFRLEFSRLRHMDLTTLASVGELHVRLGVSGQGVFAAKQVLQFKRVQFNHNALPEVRSRFQKAGI